MRNICPYHLNMILALFPNCNVLGVLFTMDIYFHSKLNTLQYNQQFSEHTCASVFRDLSHKTIQAPTFDCPSPCLTPGSIRCNTASSWHIISFHRCKHVNTDIARSIRCNTTSSWHPLFNAVYNFFN
jgi:hypothetical protein